MTKRSGDRVRVLHVGKFYPPVRGGMERHLQDLCRTLESDAEIDVIVGHSRARTEHERDGNVHVHRIATLGMMSSTSICPTMAAAIRRTPADIVHLHSPNPMAVLAYLASGHRGRLVVSHHSDVVRQRVLGRAYDPLLRELMRRADAIISFSPNYIDSSQALSRYRDKCHVIPHGIDPQRFESPDPAAVEAVRARYGERIVLAVGRLVYYKGFEYLIRAVAGTDATLLIIGTGPLAGELKALTSSLQIDTQVHFLGDVPDVTPYYHAAQVFALPSTARSESFGIVQLEAMASGTPVINTQLDSGVPFVSLDGVTGLTVPPADVNGLRKAIEWLLSDGELRRQFGAAARHRVWMQFTLAQMACRTLDLYEQVLRQEAAAREPEFAAAHD
jgi:glycosyltransferase involved in cell wall biosynthesis